MRTMSQRVAIVTDSTASIPVDVAEQLDIHVVQLELKIGDEYNDERRVPQPKLAEAMRENVGVATSEPPPPAFFWTYSDAAASGAEAIVSVHISEEISKTCESARAAAADLNVPVYVVDSRLAGLGVGYPVMAAAEAAKSGASVQGVLSVLDQRLRSTTQLVYVDTMEFLHRNGRISRTQAKLGQTFSIKPVLIFRDGRIEQHTKSIGLDRALRKTVSTAVKRANKVEQVDIGVEFFEFSERAEWIIEQLRAELPGLRRVTMEKTSSILGANVGPGALGVTVSPV